MAPGPRPTPGLPQISTPAIRTLSSGTTQFIPRRSSPGNRRDDREGLAGRDRRGQSVEKPDVLLIEEDVDEAAKTAVGIEDPLAEAGVGGVEGLQHVTDRRSLDGDFADPSGQRDL